MSLSHLHRQVSRGFAPVAEQVLGWISYYAAPFLIVLFSILAVAGWESAYHSAPGPRLELRVAQDTGFRSPEAALHRLQSLAPRDQYETKRIEKPIWFLVRFEAAAGEELAVEIPSRHTVALECWNAETLAPIGSASREETSGRLYPARSGFAFQTTGPGAAVCRAAFAGPAALTALRWTPEALATADVYYHRKSGLLDGGLLVLALFVAIIAAFNRERPYVLFTVWLCLNLRVAALSAGTDVQWLGQQIPDEWLLPMRAITIALYALATLELYRTLFREQLPAIRLGRAVRLAYFMCGPLLVAAIVLPFKLFLPVMWVLTGLGLMVMCSSLISIITRTGSSVVAYWFAAAFAITFLSSLSEVAAAAFGLREQIDVVNSVTAALASSMLAAVAVAAHIRKEQRQRQQAQAELQHTYEVMPIGLFTLGAEGSLLSANPAFCGMLATPLPQLVGTGWMAQFKTGTWGRIHTLVHGEHDGELEVHGNNGRRFLVKAALSQGKIEGFLQDVTAQAAATEHLRFLANHDPLTKVLNRRGTEENFDQIIGEDIEGNNALAYLDLDRFKLINDLFGHATGDEVLRQVCERISSVLASNHFVGRVGGDEFVILMPKTSIALASLIARAVVTNIGDAPYRVGNKAFQVRGSVGLIALTQGMSMKEALSVADRACREAKLGGGEGLVVYERHAPAWHAQQAELALVERLSRPAAMTDLFLHMQPIMSLARPLDSHNFEILLRMRNRDGSVTAAGPIMAAAEISGLTGRIDRWVFETGLKWIEDHHKRLEKTRFVCINLSGASLNDERFIHDTLELLEAYPVGARYLCVEITESVALHDLDNTRRFIEQLRNRGVRVALDDFGAGYTSFTYLRELPADVLKIDGQFVRHLNAHPSNIAIVEAVVKLAANLGMKTIAEWAEDADTARTLAEIGVDYVQGFVIARPQPPEQMIEADSAAAFIADPEMKTLVQELSLDRGEDANSLLGEAF